MAGKGGCVIPAALLRDVMSWDKKYQVPAAWACEGI